jgi:predicted DNA-binding protein (UPF0251 family)
MPEVNFFKPAGMPMRALDEVNLTIEEAEAIRLKELEGLEQEAGAAKMNVSRPTFQRILASARQKMADALLNGKAIRIEGGNFTVSQRRFRCANSHEWEALAETVPEVTPRLCPVCNSPEVESLVPVGPAGSRRGRNWRRGRNTD